MTLRRADLPDRLNLADWFVDQAVERGDGGRTALLVGDATVTYAELADLVDRVGHVLAELGVARGDRVLLALADGVEFVAAWYAVQKLGAVTAEVYTYLQPKDYAYYLRYTEARVVVVDGSTLESVRSVAAPGQRLLVVGDTDLRPGEIAFAAAVAESSGACATVPTGPDDVAVWKFTTGSTGEPKACVHPVRSAVLSTEWYARGVLGLDADDVVLPVPKLFFGYARDLAALFPFRVGATGVLFPQRSTPERIFEFIAKYRPTVLVNVPTMMNAMVGHPDAAAQDLSFLRLCTSAGEALPPELWRRWIDTFGVEVVDGIGSSEAYHIYISNRPGSGRRGTVGQVVPGYAARVVAPDGGTVPDGEVGRLEVTGDTVALEYHGAPEKSAQTFRGTTLLTEDLFVRDGDGYFSYRGRADSLLKVAGVWVAPSEVENCLIEHPDVVECAVVGHQESGLVRLRAYVVTASERAGPEFDDDLRTFVRARLAPYKVPRDVQVLAALPRTPNGKLDRRALTAMDVNESRRTDQGGSLP